MKNFCWIIFINSKNRHTLFCFILLSNMLLNLISNGEILVNGDALKKNMHLSYWFCVYYIQ